VIPFRLKSRRRVVSSGLFVWYCFHWQAGLFSLPAFLMGMIDQPRAAWARASLKKSLTRGWVA
jgi:hypothetical protein